MNRSGASREPGPPRGWRNELRRVAADNARRTFRYRAQRYTVGATDQNLSSVERFVANAVRTRARRASGACTSWHAHRRGTTRDTVRECNVERQNCCHCLVIVSKTLRAFRQTSLKHLNVDCVKLSRCMCKPLHPICQEHRFMTHTQVWYGTLL